MLFYYLDISFSLDGFPGNTCWMLLFFSWKCLGLCDGTTVVELKNLSGDFFVFGRGWGGDDYLNDSFKSILCSALRSNIFSTKI